MRVYDITINPWRFDNARNASLSLISSDIDICIALDLDEVLMPGWREEIERVWTATTTRLLYRYDWGKNHIFNATKVHSRKGYTWRNICHEMIYPDRQEEVWGSTDFLLIKHLPDDNKSRSNYLPLLEADAKERPHAARPAYYYARELFYVRRYEDSIKEWQRYLKMPDATWYHERCYAYRTLGKCYASLGMVAEELDAFRSATKEAPNIREPWVDLAESCQKHKIWHESFGAATVALNITKREYVYTSDKTVWGSRTPDALALAAHYLGMKDMAFKYGQQALDLDPTNQRLIENMRWYSTDSNTLNQHNHNQAITT
jgi:tetratricopeptide (TPR) repeat protein